jgi:lysozyme
MLPTAKPKATLEDVCKWLKYHSKELANEPLIVVGYPGYYSKMGATPGNDRGIYDDAIFIISPTHFSSWNANVDPSVFRQGIATLAPGIHRYKRGNHGISRPGGGYPAFRPATKNEELPVLRDGVKVPWPGVAINIHRGGNNTTSSLGCQTIPPAQWDAFYAALSGEMKRHSLKTFPYVLIDP